MTLTYFVTLTHLKESFRKAERQYLGDYHSYSDVTCTVMQLGMVL